MKVLAIFLALVFSATGWAVAQAPGGNAGQSKSSPAAQTAPGNSAASENSLAAQQNDSTLQSQIENALRNEPGLSNSHVTVNVTAESIDLSGTVGSSKDKLAAERIAQSFDGNRKLTDNLMVTGHGHSDLAPDHSALNSSGTGNTQNPVTSQGTDGKTNPAGNPPPR